jgi:hypothetical protein
MPSLTLPWWLGITAGVMLLVSVVVVVIYHFNTLVREREWRHIAIFLLAVLVGAGAVFAAAVRFNLVAAPW